MFKKIELWIVLLVSIIGCLLALFFAILVKLGTEGRNVVGPLDFGTMPKLAYSIASAPEQIASNFAGLMKVDDFWKKQKPYWEQAGFSGQKSEEEMYLLLSRFDGDIGESVVELIDLRTFTILHSWNPNVREIFNEKEKMTDQVLASIDGKGEQRYRPTHPVLMSDGSIITHDAGPLVRIDSCSKLMWINHERVFHHSVELDKDGVLWVPAERHPHSEQLSFFSNNDWQRFIDDTITAVDVTDGSIVYEKSVPDIFIENGMERRLFGSREHFFKDPIHLNDIQPVHNSSGTIMEQGDLFLSLPNLMVMQFRPRTDEIINIIDRVSFNQHDIDILDHERISIFNNNSYKTALGFNVRDQNSVVVYNLRTKEVVEYLDQVFKKEKISTLTQGLHEILPNGDLFLDEQNSSRIMMIKKNGTLRWTYVNKSGRSVFFTGWPRLLYKKSDIETVKEALGSRKCVQ